MTFDPGQILRVSGAVGLRRAKLADAYNFLRGRDPRSREIDADKREAALAELKAGQMHAVRPVHWDEFLKVLERAGFRTREMITSKNTILYSYALWIIGRVDFGVPVDELREVMGRWFFMSQITGRYTNSPETRMQEDLNRLDGVTTGAASFIAVLTSQIDAAVPDDWWRVTLIDLLHTSSASAAAFVAYVAALNILDADVLLATSKVKDWLTPRPTVKGIEKHHLFPRDYLPSVLGLRDNRKINQVANFALVDGIQILLAERERDPHRRLLTRLWHEAHELPQLPGSDPDAWLVTRAFEAWNEHGVAGGGVDVALGAADRPAGMAWCGHLEGRERALARLEEVTSELGATSAEVTEVRTIGHRSA